MAIIYTCRHCNHHIGKLEENVIAFAELGFDQLSAKERQEMIQYETNGDLVVNVICDSCTEALAKHPHYHELDHFLQ